MNSVAKGLITNKGKNSGGDLLSIVLPGGMENLQLPNPELLNYYRGLEKRILWIDTEIDDCLLELEKLILLWNAEDKGKPVEEREKIRIFIFSYGGSIDACFSMLDICELSKTPIVTYNMGVSMSAGLLLLLAGSERYTLPKSQVLIHSGSGGAAGTFEQVEAQMATYKQLVSMMREYIIKRTKIDTKLLNKNKNKEWYIFAEEQVELGIVDGIISDLDVMY